MPTSHLYNEVQRGKHEQPDDWTGFKQTLSQTKIGGETLNEHT